MTAGDVELYQPINTLKKVDDDIWIADGSLVSMALYGISMSFPTRMTVVRLGNGDLWCHSPVELTEELIMEIDELGPVRHLISPNKIHYAHIASWAGTYPEATAWASPGVRERAAQQHVAVKFDADLDDAAPAAWSADITQLVFRGGRFMDELVFFHCKSKTLILADLIENFEPDKLSGKLRWRLRLAGAADPDGKAPIDLRMTFWGHKKEARQCLKRMLKWQPEKIILAHGRWYRRHGTDELKRAFRWLL